MATKRAPKKRKNKGGQRSASEILDRASDEEVRKQMLRTSHAVFRRIEELVDDGEEIPLSLLGTARMCAEYATDREMIRTAMPDLYGELAIGRGDDGGQGQGGGS